MHDMLRSRAAEFGLPFSAPLVLSNSRLAILAAEHARELGSHEALNRRLFTAYFAEGLDIGDIEVLAALGAEVGLDPAALRHSLLTDTYAHRLAGAEREARRLGITGVPTFFIAPGPPDAQSSIGGETQSGADEQSGRQPLRIVGAQPLAAFRNALREV